MTRTGVGVLDVENNDQYCYPRVGLSADGLVHMTDTWISHNVEHVVLDPQQLELNQSQAERTR